MATRAKEAVVIQPLAETMGYEKLQEIFADLIGAVNQIVESQEAPQVEDIATLGEKAKEALSAPIKIDQLVALLSTHEFQEALLRKAVQHAERRAREHKTFVSHIKGGIELYMRENGISRIEGFAHRFAMYKQPDQLDVTAEDLIPDEFFDFVPVTEKRLDKELLISALQAGVQIPGAEYYTGRKRIDVK